MKILLTLLLSILTLFRLFLFFSKLNSNLLLNRKSLKFWIIEPPSVLSTVYISTLILLNNKNQ